MILEQAFQAKASLGNCLFMKQGDLRMKADRLGRFGSSPTRLFRLGFFMSAVAFLMCILPTRLRNVGSSFAKILTLLLLLVNDLLIVRYVSWIGHLPL